MHALFLPTRTPSTNVPFVDMSVSFAVSVPSASGKAGSILQCRVEMAGRVIVSEISSSFARPTTTQDALKDTSAGPSFHAQFSFFSSAPQAPEPASLAGEGDGDGRFVMEASRSGGAMRDVRCAMCVFQVEERGERREAGRLVPTCTAETSFFF